MKTIDKLSFVPLLALLLFAGSCEKDGGVFMRENDAIACYAYLGDVEQSVTGDKKAQKYEDAYLDQLFDVLDSCGIHAVTYMPTRNTPKQLDRLRTLCQQHHMFQVSGEDINSPRQSFVIHAMEKPQFANLVRSTWQLIDHENGTCRIEL